MHGDTLIEIGIQFHVWAPWIEYPSSCPYFAFVLPTVISASSTVGEMILSEVDAAATSGL